MGANGELPDLIDTGEKDTDWVIMALPRRHANFLAAFLDNLRGGQRTANRYLDEISLAMTARLMSPPQTREFKRRLEDQGLQPWLRAMVTPWPAYHKTRQAFPEPNRTRAGRRYDGGPRGEDLNQNVIGVQEAYAADEFEAYLNKRLRGELGDADGSTVDDIKPKEGQ